MDERFLAASAAIYQGDVDALEQLLDESPALATQRSSCGHPSLLQCVAVDAGIGRIPRAVEFASLLLDRGAPQKQEAIVSAASTDARDVLKLLLDRGARLDLGAWKPLNEALYWSHTELALQLVDWGAPLDNLAAAAGVGSVARMRALVDEDGNPLPTAGPIGSPFADQLDPDRVDDGAEIMAHALVTATLNRQVSAMKWLLAHGAEVNARPTGFHWGGAALHAAVWIGDEALVQFLLDHGADAALRDRSYDADARGWAVHNEHQHLIELFDAR